MHDSKKNIPVILGHPMNGLMQLFFGNMTIDLNVFTVTKESHDGDEDEVVEVDMIEALVGPMDMTKLNARLELLPPRKNICLFAKAPLKLGHSLNYNKKKVVRSKVHKLLKVGEIHNY